MSEISTMKTPRRQNASRATIDVQVKHILRDPDYISISLIRELVALPFAAV